MKSESILRHDVVTLIMKSLAGEASPAEVASLNAILRNNRDLVTLVVDVVQQDVVLTCASSKMHATSLQRQLETIVAEALQSAVVPASGLTACNSMAPQARQLPSESSHPTSKKRTFTTSTMVLASSLLLAFGCLLGTHYADFLAPDIQLADQALLGAGKFPRESSELRRDPQSDYVASVVSATSCRWSPNATFSTTKNRRLRKGESLQLFEGIAEIRLEWDEGHANVRIEGPAGLVLTADRGCSLSHGKLTVDVSIADASSSFAIDTPNGLVDLGDKSSVGIMVRGRDVSVHAFNVSHASLMPWSLATEISKPVILTTGQSATLVETTDGNIEVEYGKSRSTMFASQLSMYTDALQVSEEYIQLVRSHDPLLYWRFENDVTHQQIVQNEVNERYSGAVYGTLQQRERAGNQFVDFGAESLLDTRLPRIECTENFASVVKEDYSLELWIKPNHYHHGSLVSFVAPESIRGDSGLIESPHGLLIEIGGPRTTRTVIEQPGKVRFLHRSPPSGRLLGTSCFSTPAYEPRKWTHVVAVKQGSLMQLYLDGKLAGGAEDTTVLAPDLRLMLGQLDQWRSERMFVGQMDEVAFYSSALSAEQVEQHHLVMRNPPSKTSPEPAKRETRPAKPRPVDEV